jgi:hypothetical protein
MDLFNPWKNSPLRVEWREGFHRANPHTEHAIGAALVDFNPRLIQIDGVERADSNTGSTKITFIVDDADHAVS